MSKREYMRGHYEECMGGGKVLPNVPKDLVIVGSEKGGIKGKPKKKELLLMQRKLNMKMKTFSNALVASMFIGMYSANIYHF